MTTAYQDGPVKPKRIGGLHVIEFREETSRYTVFNSVTGRFVRMGQTEWSTLEALDGTATLEAVARGRGIATETLAALIGSFAGLGLLEGSAAATRSDAAPSRGVWAVEAGTTVARLGRFVRIAGVPLLGLAIIATVLAALAAPGLASAPGGLLHTLPRPWVILLALAAMMPVVALHELAHGACLERFGGHPRRLGVRLRGGVPIAFCDISDAWRLRRLQRAATAAAGIVVHCLLGSLAVLAALMLRHSVGQPPAQLLLVFAALNFACAALSAVPFRDSDGYWLLSLSLDIPNLRAKANAYTTARVLAAVTKRPAPRPPGGRASFWLAYGSAQALSPLAVRAGALLAAPALLRHGRYGALIWLSLFIPAALVGLARLVRRRRVLHPLLATRVRRAVLAATLIVAAASTYVIPVPGPVAPNRCRTIDRCVWSLTVQPVIRLSKEPA
jgi:hypothetical protein